MPNMPIDILYLLLMAPLTGYKLVIGAAPMELLTETAMFILFQK